MAGNPAVMRFMGRDAGMLVLIKLVQMSATGSKGPLLHRSSAPCFGASRTHVRALLEDAAQHGDVSLSGRGGYLVELRLRCSEAFDRFVADAMSGHDLLYWLARERMAKEERQTIA